MAINILAELKKASKLNSAINQRFKGMGVEVNPPAGPFEGKVLNYELTTTKAGALCMRCKYEVVKCSDKKCNGGIISDLHFLGSDWGFSFALKKFVLLGIPNVQDRFNENGTLEFQAFVNEVNKINDLFLFSLKYDESKDGSTQYAKIDITRKLESTSVGKVEVEVEEVEEIEPEELNEVTEQTLKDTDEGKNLNKDDDDLVDDFEEETSMYDDDELPLPNIEGEDLEDDLEAEEIPELEEVTPVRKKDIKKYQKKLAEFAFAHDLFEDPKQLKKLNAREIVNSIDVSKISMNDLTKTEKTLLKNVELID